MRLKKWFICICACLLILTQNTVSSFASGMSWKLTDGILTISGDKMDDYGDNHLSPWFDQKDSIKKVVIKNGVKNIGNAAFYGLEGLLSVEIADSVTSIGNYAFLECYNLTTIKMSSNVKTIGEAAFKECMSLQSIELPNGLQSIGYEAFFLCESLKSVTIPSSVTKMEECIFTYCHGLVIANVYANIDTLPYWTFYDCDSLVSISLASTVNSIGSKAVYNCDSLTHVSSDADKATSDKIEKEIKKQVSGVNVSTNNGDSITNVYIPSGNDDVVYQETIENKDVIINSTITDTNINMDIVVNDKNGWEDVDENIDKFTSLNQSLNNTNPVNVTIQTNKDMNVPSNIITNLAGKNTNLTLKGNGYQVTISCSQLQSGKKYNDFDFQYSLKKDDNPSNAVKNAVGNAEVFHLQFKGLCDFPVTINIDLGTIYSQQFASLFQKDGSYKHVQTVRMDSFGIASFYLNNFDNLTTFLIGINVDDKYTSAIIPDDEYNGLMDAYGNRYEITGMESRWGVSLQTVLIIMAVVMVAIIAVVGGVMFYMNKRKVANQRLYDEVMNEHYNKEEHQKNYKFIKVKKKKDK